MGFTLRVWGDYACFTRPEMKVERVSYDVITPSSARAIFEAIHWKPAIRWVIDEINVIKPIKFQTILRNEVKSVISEQSIKNSMKNMEKQIYIDANEERAQRNSMILKDVEYVIKAHFEMTKHAGESDDEKKHYNIFLRRARKGECFTQPYFGCREFSCNFELLEDGEVPANINETKDLGWMLYDIDFVKKGDSYKGVKEYNPKFFRAEMIKGKIFIPQNLHKEVNK
ncbi:type I-C CRISPR-associated protein Cas5c [Candidatus Arthromitus sp. SFB-rat-Yit]|uniref:type I-C CRISPR-associated protein Cas5c n=1 Tax=Candidatus Arthromitus sp. SFB-rat-Yit TaxID=1041504 RepID=UPI000227A75A|nr:type I-C CRISPR-associated protein Cas5c [Candidatus Arthromitus sp. SFB-rat-Yit]BAK81138.1 CRISPR-associated protein Cas5 family [Candidatus Arthromitus sp. SFB-rat-Yit]